MCINPDPEQRPSIDYAYSVAQKMNIHFQQQQKQQGAGATTQVQKPAVPQQFQAMATSTPQQSWLNCDLDLHVSFDLDLDLNFRGHYHQVTESCLSLVYVTLSFIVGVTVVMQVMLFNPLQLCKVLNPEILLRLTLLGCKWSIFVATVWADLWWILYSRDLVWSHSVMSCPDMCVVYTSTLYFPAPRWQVKQPRQSNHNNC